MSGPLHAVVAYGSNADPKDLAAWFRARGRGVPHIRDSFTARLPDHRLAWHYRSPARGGGAADVIPCPGAQLPCLVLAVDEPTLAGLDAKEGHPGRYRRARAPVLSGLSGSGELREAWLYRVLPSFIEAGPVWPRRPYLELMIRAARRHGFPEAYLQALLATPTSP